MSVVGRIFSLIFGFLGAALLITLAVANRHGVRLVLDPFNPQNPVLSAELPFYAYLFGMLILGVILGGLATWITQSRWRRMARQRAHDAMRWKGEAERLIRERDATLVERRQLALVKR